MAKTTKRRDTTKGRSSTALMVRLDEQSKSFLARAAELRGISVSDYVRTVTVGQARREVQSAREQTIRLTPDEQLAFWNALQQKPNLTPAQKELGAIMRGETKAFDPSLEIERQGNVVWSVLGEKNNWLGRLRYEKAQDGRWRIIDLETLEQFEFPDDFAAAQWVSDRGEERYDKAQREWS